MDLAMNLHENLLDASCRVAFAALTHDLGKFAERAALAAEHNKLEAHVTLYCKWHAQGGYHSHKHAAHTAIFMDEIEKAAPDLIRAATFPFASRQEEKAGRDITDSLINAAAMHHCPQTLLQWIIATADRAASGFEREKFDKYNAANEAEYKTDTGHNHYQARLLTLFEQIRLDAAKSEVTPGTLAWRYPLKPLSPQNLFPLQREKYEPSDNQSAQVEYQKLWEGFLKALQDIPQSHRKAWPLWLDHFDTLWQSYTAAIPSATAFNMRPEVSLYDHCKATAALAVALWRWHIAQENLDDKKSIRQHENRDDWDEKKFLLIQGDFFGIQDFIFAEGAETNKHAAKILRGRSFQVSMLTELAALKILEALKLPSTSQIVNAAGKFLIVAPNTPAAREKLDAVRRELDEWFLKHTFGMAGIGLACQEASCNDFQQKRFPELIKELFADLERAKLRRFDLVGNTPAVFGDVGYPEGVCAYNNRLPADSGAGTATFSRDQIAIGKALAHKDKNRLLVVREGAELEKEGITQLETSIFGYRVAFTANEDITGRFGKHAQDGAIPRFWDFSLPRDMDDTLWHGYARRYINAYVPCFSKQDIQVSEKYDGSDMADDAIRHDIPKTFEHLACEDRVLEKSGEDKERWVGITALATLKGDVDNLGRIFQQGLSNTTFAKMAALSRQMNAFFAIWLPAFCQKHHPNVYTVFAGGDDFFMIGPWRDTQRLAGDMADAFKRYVAENSEIHFSAGIVMTKPQHPVYTLAELAETALDAAKGYAANGHNKNAISVYGEVVPWPDWAYLAQREQAVHKLAREYKLSMGYIYGLLQLVGLAEDTHNLESAMWRSRFAYRTRRYVVDKLDKDDREPAQRQLTEVFGEGIASLRGRFRFPLFNYFYSKR